MANILQRIKNVFIPQPNSMLDLERLIEQSLQSEAGLTITPRTANQFTTVFSCVRLLSDTLAQMPCKMYKADPSRDTREVNTSDPLYNILANVPENGLTAFDFWKQFMMSLALKGYAVARKIYGASGNNVIRLVPLNKIDRIERSGLGEYTFHYMNDNNQQVFVKHEDAFFAFYALDNNMMPISPIKENKNSIGLGMAAEKHGSKTFRNNATPTGALKYPNKLDKEIAKKLKEGWDAAYGVNGVGGVAVLEGGAEYQKISMSNEDAQFLQTRQFQKQEICGIYGVPPHMISDTAQAKGWSTMEQMMIEFLTLGMNPWIVRLEQAIKKHLIPKDQWPHRYAKFSTNALLRGDTRSRASFYESGIKNGWMLPNEARGFEDMNPLDESQLQKGANNEQIAS